MLTILFRSVFYYIFIVIIFRITGKKEIGELGIMDLLFSILITEFVVISIENYNDSILISLIPIIVIVIFQMIFSRFPLKSFKFKPIIDPKTSLIIKNGMINFKEIERQRYSLDDLLTQIHDKGIKALDEIEYAILEKDGKLSTFLYDNKKTYPLPLILDGVIQYDTLNNIGKNRVWLMQILESKKAGLNDVFYAFYKNDKCFIINKND